MVLDTPTKFVYHATVSGPKGRSSANMTVFALPAYMQSRAGRNPDIILGVTVASAIATTLLIVTVGVAFRVYMNERAKQLLVLEREK